jgi:hypothetical protein
LTSQGRNRGARALLACRTSAKGSQKSSLNTRGLEKMSENDVIANQKRILQNQKSILANQNTIKANQETIKRNQASILKNQSALGTIVKNQKRILAKLA